ncbi:MAG: T9SS type A sorting domain-containing protein [Bacteroidia bacterium]
MKNIWTLLFVAMASLSVAQARPVSDPPVEVNGGGPSFTLNPNPVTGSYFYVNLLFDEVEFPNAVITINDVLGKAVFVHAIKSADFAAGRVRISTQDAMIQNGVYFVQVKSGDTTRTLKLAIR